MKKIAVLASGNGSNFQAVVDAINQGVVDAKVCLLLSNEKDAFAIQRAKNANISYCYLQREPKEKREDYDVRLKKVLESFSPDYVFLLGWMRILTKNVLEHFTFVNLHPALPNTFAGTHCIEKQFEAFQVGDCTETGIMTHYVPNEEVDKGPVIFTEVVPCIKGESLENFEERIHKAEHALVVKTLKSLC